MTTPPQDPPIHEYLPQISDTDAGLCKECSIAQVPDSELCEGCRIHWIVTIQFSDDLRAAISLSFAVLGCIGSGLVFWLYRVEDEGGPVMIEVCIIV